MDLTLKAHLIREFGPAWRWTVACEFDDVQRELCRQILKDEDLDFACELAETQRRERNGDAINLGLIRELEALEQNPGVVEKLTILLLGDCDPTEIAELVPREPHVLAMWSRLYCDFDGLEFGFHLLERHLITEAKSGTFARDVRFVCIGGRIASLLLAGPEHLQRAFSGMTIRWELCEGIFNELARVHTQAATAIEDLSHSGSQTGVSALNEPLLKTLRQLSADRDDFRRRLEIDTQATLRELVVRK